MECLTCIKALLYLQCSGATPMYLLDLVISKKYFSQNLHHLWLAFTKF